MKEEENFQRFQRSSMKEEESVPLLPPPSPAQYHPASNYQDTRLIIWILKLILLTFKINIINSFNVNILNINILNINI